MKNNQQQNKKEKKETSPDLHSQRNGKRGKKRNGRIRSRGKREERERNRTDGRRKERAAAGRGRRKMTNGVVLAGPRGPVALRGPNQRAAWRADRSWLPAVTASFCDGFALGLWK